MADQRNAPGLGELLKELAEGSGELIRQEVALVRLEATQLVRGAGTGAVLLAAGGVVALVGALCLLAGLILLAGDQWLKDNYWLAALIVTLIAGAATGFYAWRGARRLAPAHLAPNETVRTLKEDVEWLKRQRT